MYINTKTRKIALIAGVSLFAGLLAYGALLFLMIRNINTSVSASIELSGESNKEANLRLLKKSINDTEEARVKIASRFVSEDGIVSFIEKVESLGEISRAHVTIRSVSVEGEKNDILKLELSAGGSFSEVFHFLTLVENLPFKVVLEKTSMLKLPKEKGDNKWEAMLTLDVLSFGGTAGANNKQIP